MRLSDRVAHIVVHQPRKLWYLLIVLVAVCASLLFLRGRLHSDVLEMLPAEFESVQIYKLSDRNFSAARDLMFGLSAPDEDVDIDGFTDHFVAELRKEPWAVRIMEQSPMVAPGGVEEIRAVAMPLILNQQDDDFAKTLAALKPEAIRSRIDMLKAKVGAPGRSEADLKVDPLGIVFPALKVLGSPKAMRDDPLFRVIFVHCDQADLNEPACKATMEKVEAFQQRVLATWPAAFQQRAAAIGWPADKGAAPVIYCTGRTAYVAEMASKLKSDIQSTMLGSILLVAVTFYAGFRRWRPLRAIVDALVLSCLLAITLGVVLFGSLNMITIGLSSLIVGLAVDFAMVMYALYLHEIEQGHSHEQAIAAALRVHGKGIWFGAMTTAAAFLCLMVSGSPGYMELGVLIACGVTLAGVVMMTYFWLFLGSRLPRVVYLSIVWLLIAGGIAGVVFVALTVTTWSTYVWQNIAAGVGSAVVAVLLVFLLQKVTARLPGLVFSRPWRLLAPSLVALVALTVCSVLPIGRVAFDINPKTLEPKPSNAGTAMREIMARLNPGGLDSIMAIIEAPDAEGFSSAWAKADTAWRKLTEPGPDGAEPMFKSMNTPAGLATSPARMQANAKKLAALDFAASKKSFDDALEANDFAPEGFAPTYGLLAAFREAAAGNLSVVEWRNNLPQTSAWWFVIDGLMSRERPLGRAMLTPSQPIVTRADADAVRNAMAVPGVQVGLSGWGFTLTELKPWSEGKMVLLSGLMIVINIVILSVLLREWKPVAIIMLGLAFSTAGLFMTLKLTGLTLNLFNVLAFPLVLGVGVDYSIYATLAVRSSEPRRELTALMKPLLLSALTTVIGFITLAWSYNPALRGLGLLCGLGVAWCMITTFLFVLPACALLAKKQGTSEAPGATA